MPKNPFPSRIDIMSRKLIFWEFYTHKSVISATTFIKNGPNFAPPCLFQEPHLLKSRNQEVQLPTTLIWATRLLKINIKVKIKLLNAWLYTQKNKSFECGIVINCFENIYCQMYMQLNTGVLLIQFNSIE